MFLFKNNIKFILLFFPIISFFGCLWQGQYTYDGYHWGFIFSNALDLLEGKEPYKEIFIQYGLFSTLIHSLILFIFNKNIFSLVFVTSVFYASSIYMMGLLTYKFTLNKYYSFFSTFILFSIYPWPTSPWPNFISFFFITLFCFFYINKKKRYSILSGVSLGFAYLSLTIIYNFVIILFLILLFSLVFFLKNKYDRQFYSKNLYFLSSFISTLSVFFFYLFFYNLTDNWFLYQKIPFILADVYNISILSKIINYFEFLTIYSLSNFIYEPQFLIFSFIFFVNIYFLAKSFFFIVKKDFSKVNIDLFVINILVLTLNFKAQLFGIEKLSTSLSLGLITIMVLIKNIKSSDNKLIINFVILFITLYGISFSYEMSNSHYAGARSIHLRDLKNINLKYKNNTIKYFTLQKWSDENWKKLTEIKKFQKKIQAKCNLRFGANLTSDTFFYTMLNYEKIQIVPFWIKTHSHILRKYFEPNLIKDVQNEIDNNNILILSHENNDKLFNLNNYAIPKKINLNSDLDTVKKYLYIFVPKKCKLN